MTLICIKCLVFLYLWFLLIWSRSVKGQNGSLKEYFSAIPCEYERSTFEGTCEPHDDGVVRLTPESGIPFDEIKHLSIVIPDNLNSFEIHDELVFQNMKQLVHLEISSKVWLFSAPLLRNWKQVMRNLFYIDRLEVLIVNGSNFNYRYHFWSLPSTLKKLVLRNCDYTTFNLNCCPNLEYLDLSNNPLSRIPTFTSFAPPLETLILLNNPLYDFSLRDIARLCRLKDLQLGYYSAGSQHRRCECRRLQNWAKETGNTTYYLKCNVEAVSAEQCNEYDLDEAYAARRACLNPPVGLRRKILMTVLIIVLILAAIGGCFFIFWLEQFEIFDDEVVDMTKISTAKPGETLTTTAKDVEGLSTAGKIVASTTTARTIVEATTTARTTVEATTTARTIAEATTTSGKTVATSTTTRGTVATTVAPKKAQALTLATKRVEESTTTQRPGFFTK